MNLRELDAQFIKREGADNTFWCTADIKAAAGIMFLCPKCYRDNNGSKVGVHSVICWSPEVPQSISPTPGRWAMHGTGIDDLTLVAGSSSIQLTGKCAAHFWVKGGEIVGLS